MEGGETSGVAPQFVHWEDQIDGSCDSDYDSIASADEDNERLDPSRDQFEFILQRMFAMVEECSFTLTLIPPVMRIPQ